MLRVAADASLDERTGLAWYEVELAMGRGDRAGGRAVGGGLGRPTVGRRRGRGTPTARGAGSPGKSGRRTGCAEALSGRRGGERPRALPPPGPGPGNAVSVLVLTPGMPVEVYLRTGERSPLGYLVKPLSDYFSRALREE